MPTYEYKCEACGFEFEKFQSIKAASVRKCPHCGKNRVKRLISSGAGLIFKGGGFYITDYRSEAYKSAAKADSPEKPAASKDAKDSGGESSSKPSTESKPPAESKPAAESKPSKDSKTPAKPTEPAKPAKR
ncbi:MAG TPA: FmdB family zinc ribbon protein [Tepidisphaeraceae bacterium]|jgi:putative FmdB family regulatory protein|nr:FmdB family zinc ribbon protein [Tepidisphaeraceae bacterium]